MTCKKIILWFCVIAVSIKANAQSLKDAIHLTDNEQYEIAIPVFKALVAAEPGNGTNYYFFGENYLLNDNADSATLMFNKGKLNDPNNVLNAIGLAKVKLNQFSVPEMKALSDRMQREADKAKKEYDALQNKTAEDQVRLIGEMQARASDALAKYGTAKANVAEANLLLDEAIAKAGAKNTQVLIEAADAYIKFKNKDVEKAKLLLDKAVVIEPKNPEIQILYGDIYFELNNGTLAAEYYNKALELDKNSAKAIVSKGKLYRRSTNYGGAAEEFQNAIKIDAAFAPAHRELGEAYWKLGKLDKAKEEYKAYLDLSKNNKSARIRYASFLYYSKDYSGAVNEINQLSKFDPDNLTLLRIATYCYYETKDTARALRAVHALFSKLSDEKLISLDYEYNGKILALSNQDSLAIINLRKAFEMDNSRCDLLNELWKSYDKLKKNTEAAQVLQEKIQNCKGATTVDYFYLGRSYFYAEDYQHADTAFARLNEIAPKYAIGFLWRAKANSYIDSTSALGMAKPFYEKYIEIATLDTVGMAAGKYKAGLIESYKYMTAYSFSKKAPEEIILGYLKKILELDPEDEYAKINMKNIQLQKKKSQ